jgi:hypothetical protein
VLSSFLQALSASLNCTKKEKATRRLGTPSKSNKKDKKAAEVRHQLSVSFWFSFHSAAQILHL